MIDSRKFCLKTALVLLFLAVGPQTLFAYTDLVDAPAQEIYEAAKVCLKKEGVSADHPDQKSFTTRWVYTTIEKSHRMAFTKIKMKDHVRLRCQMTVASEEGKAYTKVSVNGWFQEKKLDDAPQQAWRNSVSSRELYFKERETFFKILSYLESQKKSSSATFSPVSTVPATVSHA